MGDVQYPTPSLPAHRRKTYAITAPPATHTRPAKSCAEVDCDAHLFGWDTILPADDPRCDLVRLSGRAFTEHREGDGLVTFRHPPGQNCYRLAEHRVPLDRPALYVVRDGDWRGNPTGRQRVHVNGDEWVEDFAEHQAKLHQAQQ